MSKQRKNIPSFKREEEERVFWETHDSTEYQTIVWCAWRTTVLLPLVYYEARLTYKAAWIHNKQCLQTPEYARSFISASWKDC